VPLAEVLFGLSNVPSQDVQSPAAEAPSSKSSNDQVGDAVALEVAHLQLKFFMVENSRLARSRPGRRSADYFPVCGQLIAISYAGSSRRRGIAWIRAG
jgi:hypothetical protein